jgi:isocitrate dehydrogenase
MGNVCNIGLMALEAEEYGSHDKTFEAPFDGTIRVRDKTTNEVYFEHYVRSGDIWRMCQAKDAAIRDWVKLAVTRANETGAPAIFWLDQERAHDSVIIEKTKAYLKEHDTSGVAILIMAPTHAVHVSMERATAGLDTISVTGNVLRDYLTDLFPILELGTSAKVLSIVPLLSGGGLYETGAGGSAPKHVQQFVKCDHLRWNSLGEYQAMAEAFIRLGKNTENKRAILLGECLYDAVGSILERHEMPERRVHEVDNRDTNYFLALHWAEHLGKEVPELASIFQKLSHAHDEIVSDMKECQGREVDLGGYYLFDYEKANRAMNPSRVLTEILSSIDKTSASAPSP